MDKKTRGCLWAGCGVAVLVLVVGVTVAGGLAWMVYQGSSMRLEHPDAAQAHASIDALRRRFAGQRPLVTVGVDGSTSVIPRPQARHASPESLHLMSWKPEDKELAQVQFPFWLLRLGGDNAKFNVNGVDALAELRKVNVTLQDVERSGPGLVLDHTDRNGAQVLIWTE